MWIAGPDLVASVLLSAREHIPNIQEAFRIATRGKQRRLSPIKLRGAIFVDPRKEDFSSNCINTHDGIGYRLNKLSRADIITLGDVLCGCIQHPEIKSLGPDGEKCTAHGLLRRMTIKGGLQHGIGKEVSRFERGKDDFIENIDDMCIRYDGGRVAANDSLVAEIRARGLRKTTKDTGLDRKTIRAVLNEKVKVSTLAKVAAGFEKKQLARPYRMGADAIPDGNQLQSRSIIGAYRTVHDAF